MGMRKSGLKQGDRVLLFSGNDLFFPVVFMGIIMAGGIFKAPILVLWPVSWHTSFKTAERNIFFVHHPA